MLGLSPIFLSSRYPDQLIKREIGQQISLNDLRDQRIIRNITQDCYSEKMYRLEQSSTGQLSNIKIQDIYAVTFATNAVTLWNLETGNCQWTFTPNPSIEWPYDGLIKIIENCIVCTGMELSTYKDIICFFDLETGVEKARLTHEQLNRHLVTFLGNQIFAAFKNGEIQEWNRQEMLWQNTHVKINYDPSVNSWFIGVGDFLTYSTNSKKDKRDEISIYNIKTKREIQLLSSRITAVYMNSSHLVCACSTEEEEERKLTYSVVSLENGQKEVIIINFNKIYPRSQRTDLDWIKKIIMDKKWIYSLYESTNWYVMATNLETKETCVLGEHAYSIGELVLENQLLISHCLYKIKYWNAETKQLITEKDTKRCLRNMTVKDGQVFAIDVLDLIQLNYLSSQDGSPKESHIFGLHNDDYLNY